MNVDLQGDGCLEWLDSLRDQMLGAKNLRVCVTTGASWLCEWIDRTGLRSAETGYREFCCLMAEEMEAWRGEDEELWAWSWETAGEMFRFYEDLAQSTDQEFAARVCEDNDDPVVENVEDYAKHLFLCAVSFIHGWACATCKEK